MTIDERLDRLTGIVEALAGSVVAHDDQIEALIERTDALIERTDALIKVDELQQKRLEELARSQVNTERMLMAYINTLPRH